MTRRQWIALSGLLVGSACSRKKAIGYNGYALVATSGETSLAVVDLRDFKLLRPVPLGAPPTSVIAGPVDDHSYVLTGTSGTIHLLDSDLKRVSSRKVSDELFDFRFMPDQRRVIALAARSRELIELDATSLKILRRHKLEAQAVGFDVTSSQYTAISTGARGMVELVNLATGQHARMQFAGPIGTLRFRRDGAVLLVANLHNRSLIALDVPTLQIVVELPLAMQPDNLCFNADGGQLFVSGAGMDGVAIVFPYYTLEVDQTVLTGRAPRVMACSETPPYLFVASRNASDVCILDVSTRKMIGIVEVGGVPVRMAITPDSQYALLLDERSGSMAVIDIPAIRRNRLKSGASLFTMIPVGDKPVDAAVVARSG